MVWVGVLCLICVVADLFRERPALTTVGGWFKFADKEEKRRAAEAEAAAKAPKPKRGPQPRSAPVGQLLGDWRGMRVCTFCLISA